MAKLEPAPGTKLDDAAYTRTVGDEYGVWTERVTWREVLRGEVLDEIARWPAPRLVGLGLNDAAWAVRTAKADFILSTIGFLEWVTLAAISSILIESRDWVEAAARLRALITGLTPRRSQYGVRAWALSARLAPALRVAPEAVFELLRATKES